MWKLNHSKGFTIIEVMCSISIFTLLFLSILAFQMDAYKVYTANVFIKAYTLYMEGVKNKILANSSFEELKVLNIGETLYIPTEDLNIETIKTKTIGELVQYNIPESEPYILLKLSGTDVLQVNIELHYKEFNQQRIKSIYFYKGNY